MAKVYLKDGDQVAANWVDFGVSVKDGKLGFTEGRMSDASELQIWVTKEPENEWGEGEWHPIDIDWEGDKETNPNHGQYYYEV